MWHLKTDKALDSALKVNSTPSVRWRYVGVSTQWRGILHFQRISSQNGCHRIWDALYNLWNWEIRTGKSHSLIVNRRRLKWFSSFDFSTTLFLTRNQTLKSFEVASIRIKLSFMKKFDRIKSPFSVFWEVTPVILPFVWILNNLKSIQNQKSVS